LSLKPISANRLIKILAKAGFTPVRRRGSHIILRHADGRLTVVPMHEGEEIGRGLLSKFIKEAGLTREKYLELVDST
jgi:predicted RNA binding protein YcfA (HicA-like mRNA interferase family)